MGPDDCNHDWSIFPYLNRFICNSRLMDRATRRTIGSTSTVVSLTIFLSTSPTTRIGWLSGRFHGHAGFQYTRAFMFGSKIQFRILGIYLSPQISKLQPFRLHFNCAVATRCKNSLYAQAEWAERTRGQRRESSYEGSLARLLHQRLEHHSPTCHRSRRGFATPPQLQADWLYRVLSMYSLTIASLREVLRPTVEDCPLRVLRNPRVVIIQSWSDPASHVYG